MQPAGVHHVSLNVTNTAEATAFYTDVLGLRLIDRPDFPFDGAWLEVGGQQVLRRQRLVKAVAVHRGAALNEALRILEIPAPRGRGPGGRGPPGGGRRPGG